MDLTLSCIKHRLSLLERRAWYTMDLYAGNEVLNRYNILECSYVKLKQKIGKTKLEKLM